jgi:MFS family permease
MKTTFKFGAGIAVTSFAMGLILFFLGFHNEPEKLSAGQWIGSIGAILITAIGLTMAMKARREEMDPEEGFGYGRAMGTGSLTSLWSSLLGAILTMIYAVGINPNMQEIIMDNEIAKMEEKGMPANAIEQAEGIMKFITSPAMMGVTNFIMGIFFGVIISLIIAAFVKRPAVDVVPPPIEA